MPRAKVRCPNCDAGNPLPIVYGLPDLEAARKAEAGEIALGGCVVTGDDPRWRCRTCGYEWGGEQDNA